MDKIKKTIKRTVVFLLCAICCFNFNSSLAHANENTLGNNIDYFALFYGGDYEILVTNSSGADVTNDFLNTTKDMYVDNDINSIKQLIGEQELVLRIISETEMSTYAYDQYKSVRSEMMYFILNDKNFATTIEVTSELVGGIWYNPNTFLVTNVSTPTYNILTMRTNAAGIQLSANNFRTGSSVQNGKGYFWGECSFMGQNQDTLPLYYDYGSKRVSFYATP